MSNPADPALAIVIPSHRTLYLRAALDSLADQSDRRFAVYVGDDASADDIAGVCADYAGRLPLRLHRFTHNRGRTDLVGQWRRCLALCSEPWVWMIGDDDELEAGCVAAFHAARAAAPQAELFHFGVRRIDAQGRVIDDEPEFASPLSARAFLLGRLRFALASYAPDYVFSRAAFDRAGGFVDFPLAWCSDDATWAKLAARHGIHSVRGPRVRWRLSGSNISSRNDQHAAVKLQAHLLFVEWLARTLPTLPRQVGDPGDDELLGWARYWFFEQAERAGSRFWPAQALPVARRLAAAGVAAWPQALLRSARADWNLRQKSRAR
jgi:glycosyltransferase involved in cell wall biosynthesis